MSFTIATTNDGFGAQYQKIIQTYIYCKLHNLNFLYKPFTYVEHNYDNDINYVVNIENLINLKNNIKNLDDINIATEIDFNSVVRPFFDNNIDLCCENNKDMKFIKDCFWANKERKFLDNGKFNVAVHIRRENHIDNGLAGERATTPNSYYLKIMNYIRETHTEKDILFHIYSQGDINDFSDLDNIDVLFYINYDMFKTFIEFVSADILVISPSSFSYVAALISDGKIYYKNFWHNPKKNWIIYN